MLCNTKSCAFIVFSDTQKQFLMITYSACMPHDDHQVTSSIIISVYKDDDALALILRSLENQTKKDFNIIVSEDGNSETIKSCLQHFSNSQLSIKHLSQKDDGFRKNIALNRAIISATSDHLIFIDGDCIPHNTFIESHQQFNSPGLACTGRRLELGQKFSNDLRSGRIALRRLTNPVNYLLNIPALIQDKAKNIESGIYSKRLSTLITNRPIRLLGCNFSCNKNDLVKINGFNEEYLSPGIGEDSDIDWRLIKSGVTIKNVKFSAIQYHLHHPRSYTVSEKNIALFNSAKLSDTYTCKHGLRHTDN